MFMTTSPKICIYGAGAIGGMIGTRLALAGAEVGVVARRNTLAALQTSGLRVIMGEQMVTAPVKAVAEPAALGVQDYVIIAVKAPALREIAQRIAPLIGPETTVVTAMNGIPWWFFANDNGPLAGRSLPAVDPDGSIARAIPAAQTLGCVVYLSAQIERPGVVRHNHGNRLLIGENDDRLTPRLYHLGGWLRRAGFDAVESTDIRREIWLKLWGNLCFNPISALTRATLDIVTTEPCLRDLSIKMMTEAQEIASRFGVTFRVSIERRVNGAARVGAHRTSMLQDLESGRPLEIDALLTSVQEMGRLAGVDTPYIDTVLGLVQQLGRSLNVYAPAPIKPGEPARVAGTAPA
jgi:2-dehydropantoate 2-reductase